ncbi:putative holin-like toxin [Effusibacillus pohliae]
MSEKESPPFRAGENVKVYEALSLMIAFGLLVATILSSNKNK